MAGFLRDFRQTFIFHAVASHFVNGLVPVAIFFLILTIPSGDPYFEHTVLHLIAVVSCAIPVCMASGIREWQRLFRGARAPIFLRKIKLSILLLLLSLFSLSLRLRYPDLLTHGGLCGWLYMGAIFLMMPIVIQLGHYGGKLAAQARRIADLK